MSFRQSVVRLDPIYQTNAEPIQRVSVKPRSFQVYRPTDVILPKRDIINRGYRRVEKALENFSIDAMRHEATQISCPYIYQSNLDLISAK